MDYTVVTLSSGGLFIRQSSLAFFVTADHADFFINAGGDSIPEIISVTPLHFEADTYSFEIRYDERQQKKFDVPRYCAKSSKGGVMLFCL
jgi:hypothetical protein